MVLVGEADLIVGWDPACDVVIDDDPRVSARHLRLRRTDKGVRVQDLGSRNGTFVTAPGDKVGGSRIGWRFMWRPGP